MPAQWEKNNPLDFIAWLGRQRRPRVLTRSQQACGWRRIIGSVAKRFPAVVERDAIVGLRSWPPFAGAIMEQAKIPGAII